MKEFISLKLFINPCHKDRIEGMFVAIFFILHLSLTEQKCEEIRMALE